MKTFELKATSRQEIGKKSTKTLRTENKVPGVLYGGGENIHFATDEKAFSKLIYTPNSYITHLEIDGKVETAILKDVQYHPVSDRVLHVDFTRVNEKDPIIIDVPVITKGLAKGVKAGGKLSLSTRKLKVKAEMANLPEVLTVDVSDLELGQSIQVGQLDYENLELMNSPKAVVVQVKLTRAARAAAATAEAGK